MLWIDWIDSLLRFKRKENINKQFHIYRNFNYCPLVWHFSYILRALRFLLNDYQSDYKTLLKKSKYMHNGSKRSIELYLISTLETFKKLNDLAKSRHLWKKNLPNERYQKRRKNKLNRNPVKYGDKSIRSLGPHS